MGLIQDFTFEVRKKMGPPMPANGTLYAFKGTIDQHIAPSLTQELGSADQLTFSMLMSDPKIALFSDENQNGLEIWFYGRDKVLKQIFVVSIIELIRDYGATSMSSGSGSLGSGSGDSVLITCTGIENYLSRYVIGNYKVTQRMTSDILWDIVYEPWQDWVVSAVNVDPALNMLLDIDLSWENVQTAVNNIIAQTGGYMQLQVDTAAPDWRVLNLIPLPGSTSQPTDVGMTSAILPQ